MNLTVTQKVSTPPTKLFDDIPFGDWFCHPDHGLCIKIDHSLGWSIVNKERLGVGDVEPVHVVKVNISFELVGPKE